jgi:hypothetical protein
MKLTTRQRAITSPQRTSTSRQEPKTSRQGPSTSLERPSTSCDLGKQVVLRSECEATNCSSLAGECDSLADEDKSRRLGRAAAAGQREASGIECKC